MDGFELRLSLSDGYALFQAAETIDHVIAPVPKGPIRYGLDHVGGHIHLRHWQSTRPRVPGWPGLHWSDADYLKTPTAKGDVLSNDIRIRMKLAAPERFTNNRHQWPVRDILFFFKPAPQFDWESGDLGQA